MKMARRFFGWSELWRCVGFVWLASFKKMILGGLGDGRCPHLN